MIVAALADPGSGVDVVDRFFAPGAGVPEDPATGSAHCILTPLYAAKLGRTSLRFHQAYPGRGGDLACELRGDRVILSGSAVTVADTTLRPHPRMRKGRSVRSGPRIRSGAAQPTRPLCLAR